MAYNTPDILNMAACFAFILSGVICGVIRWLHMCHPYNQQADYFYPARKGAMLIFSGLILLLPYLLKINDNDSWFLARSFGILYYPAIFSWLILRYFKGELGYKGLRHLLLELPTIVIIFVLLLGSTSLYSLSSFESSQYMVGIWGIILFIYLINITIWLKKRIDNYHYERYSNPDDFPYRFAERVLFTPFIVVSLMWIVYITDSQQSKMIIDWLMTIYNVGFLCVILHPQRQILSEEQNKTLKRIETTESKLVISNSKSITQEEADKKVKLTQEQLKHYQDLVISEIRDKRAFLDNHYTLAKLSRSIRVGRTYTSLVCTSLGGFYNLVNKYRIEYAEQYQKEHPNVTLEAVSLESGFKDRKAYHRAKKSQDLEDTSK